MAVWLPLLKKKHIWKKVSTKVKCLFRKTKLEQCLFLFFCSFSKIILGGDVALELFLARAASSKSNPGFKGPPISLSWRNVHSVTPPIHSLSCLSESVCLGMELDEEMGEGGVSRFLKEDISGMVSGRCGLLTRTDWWGVGGISVFPARLWLTPGPCTGTINSKSPSGGGHAWWEGKG